MPIAWFICPYKRRDRQDRHGRYCAMDDFTQQIIYQDGGNWTEAEALGNVAVVKVKASAETISLINAAEGFVRLPKDILDASLSDFTTQQKSAIRNKLQDMGYTLAEIKDKLGSDIGSLTLRDVLRFAVTRRRKSRYDSGTDTIICDGEIMDCRSIENVDEEVQ